MADSASEIDLESDTSSVDGSLFQGGSGVTGRDCESRASVNSVTMAETKAEEQSKRLDSLQQENRVLKMEVDTYKLKCKQLQEDNRELRKASVSIQAKAEQEEEFISNTLLKKIDKLKKEKETLAMNYEQEEEYLTNDLSRKLMQLRQEKAHLEETLEREQEFQVNKLMRKIEKLESETMNKQITLEQLRREKVELENALEQEQESLVNRLWKRMEKLESEKRMLQEKLNEPVSAPPSPRDAIMVDAAHPFPTPALNTSGTNLNVSGRQRRHSSGSSGSNLQHPFAPPGTKVPPSSNRMSMPPPPGPDDAIAINMQTAGNLTQHIQNLRHEVHRLRESLRVAQKEHTDKMAQYMQEEKNIREENLRLQRKLQLETERRENLCRHLSESESSLEMDEERHFHEMATGHPHPFPTSPAMPSGSLPHVGGQHRTRTASSPIPYGALSSLPAGGPSISRPMSPAGSLSTSIPKTGAALMEASLGLSASTSTSSVAASAPQSTALFPPTISTVPCASRCPNCGFNLNSGGLSPIGSTTVITASHVLAPVASVPALGRGTGHIGDPRTTPPIVTVSTATASPPVALVRPQDNRNQSAVSAAIPISKPSSNLLITIDSDMASGTDMKEAKD